MPNDRPHPVKSWLIRIAANTVKDSWRRRTAILKHEIVSDRLVAPAVYEERGFLEIEEVQATKKIMVAIGELPPRWLEFFKMRYFDELTPTQIAERLGVTLDTVKGLFTRTKTELQTKVSRLE